ncbi:MAG: hypothetical protein VR69_09180 [Peptococcaceae bacterium BRH_c4b]|nr:MAG: hypothetical protein VR69_09180 [Peptococcaceae bacterium BRH_c4b]
MSEDLYTVKDYMVPFHDYPSINQNATLEEAVSLMHRKAREKGYRWLVVLDDGGKIKGFLTLRNVFEAISELAPKAGGWLGVFTYNRPGYFYWEGLQLIKDTRVKKLIKPLIDVSVYETDSPVKAAEIIINRRITILPILNAENKTVGIVRQVDLLPFIKGLFENAPVSV